MEEPKLTKVTLHNFQMDSGTSSLVRVELDFHGYDAPLGDTLALIDAVTLDGMGTHLLKDVTPFMAGRDGRMHCKATYISPRLPNNPLLTCSHCGDSVTYGFQVHPFILKNAGFSLGDRVVIHLPCLEERLGRKLKIRDFTLNRVNEVFRFAYDMGRKYEKNKRKRQEQLDGEQEDAENRSGD